MESISLSDIVLSEEELRLLQSLRESEVLETEENRTSLSVLRALRLAESSLIERRSGTARYGITELGSRYLALQEQRAKERRAEHRFLILATFGCGLLVAALSLAAGYFLRLP